MEETVKQRLIKFLEYKKLGQNKFERMVGLSLGYVSKLRIEPSPTKLRMIINAFPELNSDWLLTGDGEMIVPNNEVTPKIFPRRAGIPLVSQYAYAGYLAGYGDAEYIESLPLIDFTPDREMTGNWLAFEVRGDSMDDGSKNSYVQGEIVICREVEPYLYKDCPLHYKQRDFVIVHEDGILIKQVIAHDVEHHTIVIHSLNPEYPDRTIDLAQVRQIFSVVESRMQRKR